MPLEQRLHRHILLLLFRKTQPSRHSLRNHLRRGLRNMALIKKQDISKMNINEATTRLKELKLELAKAHVTAHRATAKTKEIKRTVARLMTRLMSIQMGASQK